jgi:hypothetical protein
MILPSRRSPIVVDVSPAGSAMLQRAFFQSAFARNLQQVSSLSDQFENLGLIIALADEAEMHGRDSPLAVNQEC